MRHRLFQVEGRPKGAMAGTSDQSLLQFWLSAGSATIWALIGVSHFVSGDWDGWQWLQLLAAAVWAIMAPLHLRSFRVLKRCEAERADE